MTFRHQTVLGNEVVEGLAPVGAASLMDLTLGGGGHTELLLRAAPGAVVLGVDRDPDALEAAQQRLAWASERLRTWRGAFGGADVALDALAHGERADDGDDGDDVHRVHGIVLDAGVSSPQLDRPERGFSFQREGPLDMRMSGEGESAADLLDRLEAGELARIFRDYGEIRAAGRLAREVLSARREGRLATTLDLAALCERVLRVPGPPPRVHPATLPFQALRIAVNDELGELQRALRWIPKRLLPGGRAAIISFHSLEDRLVKRSFAELVRGPQLPAEIAARLPAHVPAFRLVGRLVRATEEEIAWNPRARSARLRILERVARGEGHD